ncbi:MFS transporter [Streptomyces sp. BI20]|uniref:MFS transporter n=1 Tax=Streptomyces sp. BI20 TaxID=3403460 RepID=UPI003C76A731
MSHDTSRSSTSSTSAASPTSATSAAPSDPATGRPGRRLLLAVVLTGELMAVLDASVVDTALPAIQADTGASAAGLQWVHAAYGLTFALGLIAGGRLGDLHGRRRVFLLGTALFTLTSVLCGLAPDPGTLIAARAAQGAAAALMIPQVLATLHVSFDGAARARAFALYGTVLSVGSVAGPALGGVLTQVDLWGLGWRPIFLINLPIGAAALLLGRRYLTESRERTPARVDVRGLALAMVGLLLIAWPLSAGGGHGWAWWAYASMATGAVVLAGLARRERAAVRAGGPTLVTWSLFAGRAFAGGLGAQLVLGLLSGLLIMAWTFFMQKGLGMSPSRAALGFVFLSLAEVCGAWLAMPRVARHGRRIPQAGALCAAAGVASFGWLVEAQGTGVTMTAMALPVGLLGLGLGLIGAPLTDLTLSGTDEEHAGSAAGLFNTAIHLGITLGIVLTGVVFFAEDHEATARGAEVAEAFAGTLPYVVGGLLLMWALMLALPRPPGARRNRGGGAGGAERAS